jgi:hypothetical protein
MQGSKVRVAGIDRSAYHSVPPTRLEFNQYAVQTAVNGGSELLIFVPRAAHSHELSLTSSLMTGQFLPIQTLWDGPPRLSRRGRDV